MGQSPNEAWKTLAKVGQVMFKSGDSILFKCGEVWQGNPEPKGSFSCDKSIVVASNGSGEKPVLNAAGAISSGQKNSSAIRLYNQEYWTFGDIHVKNSGSATTFIIGILAEGQDIGTLHGLILLAAKLRGTDEPKAKSSTKLMRSPGFKFINLDVTDVNGDLGDRER